MRLPAAAALSAILVFTLASCGGAPTPEKLAVATQPSTLWDHRPEARIWTQTALQTLDSQGASLVNTVPADIETYCPNYAEADRDERKAFWVNFLSALAKHESTWRPEAAGGGGRWIGLLQIAPGTAQNYGCNAQSAGELKNGAMNLACGIRIMAVTVPRDGVVSAGGRGVAADWGPFHQARKRADIQAVTRAHPACRV